MDILISKVSALLQTQSPLSLVKLHGDASNRIYFRIDRPGNKSLILMKLPTGPSSVSEEITNSKKVPVELPFVTIDRYLKSKNLPVPEILAFDPRAGLMILEDLGPETFEKRILSVDLPTQKKWYQAAIDLMVTMQSVCIAKPGEDCIAYTRSFDETLLNWEFEHFFEYGIEARLGLKISPEDKKTMESFAHQITKHLASLPQVFVHRDFQSRNLMVQDEKLKLLDFQDALLGPLPYDLVALLRDSYIALDKQTMEELVGYYVAQKKSTGLALKPESFLKDFDWMTIQRKLKDAGRFVYIDQVKKNPSFLKHIPNSLTYVKEAFQRRTELKEFFEILKKYVPEFNDTSSAVVL